MRSKSKVLVTSQAICLSLRAYRSSLSPVGLDLRNYNATLDSNVADGQHPYESPVTGNVEYLPGAIGVVGPQGMFIDDFVRRDGPVTIFRE